ncbi:MAG: aminotransferase class I/II-fold pyridoxal phosphate-dependent enzyme, partial [Acidobacteriota bacterium]|nr:aminotransferase class I/II-fold pyridoxal phosphate-dependent enzyme [Acidobacteriota bacterium]
MDDLKTKSLHAGAVRPRIEGAITTPIFQSSTFEYHGEDYHDIGYIRLSTTPNHVVLGERVAALHNAEASLATGSGMAAISATILTILSTGDHLIVQDCLYGGTSGLLSSLKRFGITHTAVDAQDPSSWGAARQESTRAIYFETLTNPLVQLADLEAVVEFSQEHGLVSIIDNTFASPVNFQPIVAGFDLAIESATKYMGGHSDICAGCVVGN